MFVCQFQNCHTGLGKRIFFTADGGVIVNNQRRPGKDWKLSVWIIENDYIFCIDPKPLAAIKLDDTILEDRLQPPDFKITPKFEPRIVLRKTFPETWIWANVTTGYSF